MSYTIAAAATATGLSRKTILRAIKTGKIAGIKDERGEWQVGPAELHRVFPPIAGHDEPMAGEREPYAQADVEALGEQIEALLRQAGARLREQLEEVRRDRDAIAYSSDVETSTP